MTSPALDTTGMLDVSDPVTFDRWCATPACDTRTLEEFAAEGGRPMFPPNIDWTVGGQFATQSIGPR